MVIIYEIAAKKIIPPLKGILTHRLYERGLSQRRIAEILEITQPQIHKYLKTPVNTYYEKFSEMGIDRDQIDHYVKVLVTTVKKGDRVKYALLINSIVHELLLTIACREYVELEHFCRMGRFTDPHIEYYREWVRRIAEKPGITKLIPEVGSNIVYSPRKPEDYSDIIGLTGRIVRVGSSIKIVGEPLYGGSRHLSRILLTATKYEPNYKVVMNTAYVSKVEDLASRFRVEYCGPHRSIEEFWASIEVKLGGKPDILVDYGGYGLEPNVYILTRSFEELEEIISLLLTGD